MNKTNKEILEEMKKRRETPQDQAQREKDEYHRDTEREEIEIDQPEVDEAIKEDK